MTFNLALANQVLAQIEADPSSWNQEDWRCKSGMCFAGWAAQLAGGEWGDDYANGNPSPFVTTPDERRLHCADYAKEVLGLEQDSFDPDYLFDENNTLEDLKRIVSELAATAKDQVAA